MVWPFTIRINYSSDLKIFANSWPSALNFKSFSQSVEQFFLTVVQNNFSNKIPFLDSFIYFIWTFNRCYLKVIHREIKKWIIKKIIFLLFVFNEMTFVPATALWLYFLQKDICTYPYLPFATQVYETRIGTIHLRRRQIFTILTPTLLPPAVFLLLSVRKFGQFLTSPP